MSHQHSPGFIYILSNKSMPGMVKIGRTKNLPEKRAQELSASSGVPVPFHVEWSQPVRNHEECEKKIHDALRQYRLSTNREFFQLPVGRCIGLIQNLISGDRLPDSSFLENGDDEYPKIVNGKKIVKKPMKYDPWRSKKGGWMGG